MDVMYGGPERARSSARRTARNLLLALLGVAAMRRMSRVGGIISAVPLLLYVWSMGAKRPEITPPGSPRHIPWFGALHIVLSPVFKRGVVALLHKMARDANWKTFDMTAPGRRFIISLDEADRQHILRDNFQNYQKNTPGNQSFDVIFEEVLGRGIFATDGAEWRYARKAASHLFSASALREQMEDVFVSHGRQLAASLRDCARSGAVFDLQSLLQSFTFDTMCEIAFGESLGAMKASLSGGKLPFLVAFDEAQRISLLRLTKTNFVWQACRALGIGDEGKLPSHIRMLRCIVDKIVNARTKEIATGCAEAGDKRKDLLSLFITSARESGETQFLRPEALRDVVINFMVAGRDTTACASTNLFKLLATNSEAKERLRSEFRGEITEKAGGRPTLKSLKHATFPPVGFDGRFAIAEDVLPSGHRVHPKDGVGIVNYAIGRNPNHWGEDADVFRPERWYERAEQEKQRLVASEGEGKTSAAMRRRDISSVVDEQYTLPGFWAGPRLCLGKDMARFESKVLAYLVLEESGLEIEPLPHEEAFSNTPVMFYRDGVPCRCRVSTDHTRA